MTDPDKQSKLRYIAHCNAEELRGYYGQAKQRAFFDGEQAAIMQRAKELGIAL